MTIDHQPGPTPEPTDATEDMSPHIAALTELNRRMLLDPTCPEYLEACGYRTRLADLVPVGEA